MIDLPQEWTPIHAHPGLEYRFVDYRRTYAIGYAYLENSYFEFRIDGHYGKAPVDHLHLVFGENLRAFQIMDRAIESFLAGYEFHKAATNYVV